MPIFTVYLDRDVRYEAKNDREAAAKAHAIHEALDALLSEQLPNGDAFYSCTQARRGTHNKVVFEVEHDEEGEA